MIVFDRPVAAIVAICLLVAGGVVYPLVVSKQVHVRWWKIVAVGLALAICVYHRHLVYLLATIWPLSLIWFPEFWGNYTGMFQGHYISQKSPPAAIAFMGWFLLIGFPLLIHWIRTM